MGHQTTYPSLLPVTSDMTNPYLKKRSLQLSGHRTSVALEQEFWNVLEQIAHTHNQSLSQIVSDIDASRPPDHPLSSVLRLMVLQFLIDQHKG